MIFSENDFLRMIFSENDFPRAIFPGGFRFGDFPSAVFPQDDFLGTIFPKNDFPRAIFSARFSQDDFPETILPETIFPGAILPGRFSQGDFPECASKVEGGTPMTRPALYRMSRDSVAAGRSFAHSTCLPLISEPTHVSPIALHATAVVPVPMNGS